MTIKEKDLIQRSQDIQRYTENRCNALEERNAKLEKELEELKERYTDLFVQFNKACGRIEDLTKIVEGYREAKNVIRSLHPIEWGDGFHFNVNMILDNVENPK